MSDYRINVWGVKVDYRYEVIDPSGTVVHSGRAASAEEAQCEAEQWINARRARA